MAQAEAPDAASELVLAVEAGGRRFAVAAREVAEVVRPRPLARVPHAPAALLGVAELRGTVVPVLSLARLRTEGAADAAPPAVPHAARPTAEAARFVVMGRRPPLALLVDGVATLASAAGDAPIDLDALLQRSFAAAARREPRAAAPEARSAAAEAPDEREILLFSVGGQLCGLPLDEVDEVARAPDDLLPVPGAPSGALGVMERRGALVPLGSARALLGRPGAEPRGAPVVVARRRVGGFGLAVDAVEGLARLPSARIEPVPAALARGAGGTVAAIARLPDGRLASVLAARHLLRGEASDEGSDMGGTVDEAMGAQEVEAPEHERFVVFQLGAEDYALPIAAVEEVVRRPADLARVPRAAPSVAGAMNLRGAVVPVVEAATRFAAAAPVGGGRVVVLRDGAARVGVAVDGVSEVLAVSAAAVQPAPELAADAAGTFDRVIADRGRLILVVSPRALLSEAGRAAAP